MKKKKRIKPGRKPTGRKRPFTIACLVNADEDEFISREAFDLGISKSQYLLSGRLVPDWRETLNYLRDKQKGSQVFRRESTQSA